MDRYSPGRAVTDLVGVAAQLPVLTSSVVCADDLPDGLVVTDHAARITVFNRAAWSVTTRPSGRSSAQTTELVSTGSCAATPTSSVTALPGLYLSTRLPATA